MTQSLIANAIFAFNQIALTTFRASLAASKLHFCASWTPFSANGVMYTFSKMEDISSPTFGDFDDISHVRLRNRRSEWLRRGILTTTQDGRLASAACDISSRTSRSGPCFHRAREC